ncbi:MAG: hypothetical protein PHG55_07435, partial [Verrucomicrobiota bacterium]|nr:hypothetical protein [Verrucomicrobiota bacterium]
MPSALPQWALRTTAGSAQKRTRTQRSGTRTRTRGCGEYEYDGLPIIQIIVEIEIEIEIGIGIEPCPGWHPALMDRSNFTAELCQHRNNTVA